VGAVAPDFSNQVHDFNPGIAPNGLFWTVLLPDDALSVDLAAGTAEMHVQSLEVLDGYNVISSIGGGPTEPATVSFDVWWHTPKAVEQLSDATNGFAATLLEVASAISFTARTADFAFVSDPPDTANSIFARIGYEANGSYFPGPSGTPVAATPTG
jgi:hypothetical protein